MWKAAVTIATGLALVVGILVWLASLQVVRSTPQFIVDTWAAKSIVLSMHGYQSKHRYLPRDFRAADDTPLSSWRVAVVLDDKSELRPPWDEFRTAEPWNGPHNLRFTTMFHPLFRSPEVPIGHTAFLGFRGEHTTQPPDGRKVSLHDITDGTATTLALVMVVPGRAVPWTQPTDLDLDASDFSSVHAALPERNVICVFFDGHAERLAKRPSPALLKALITIDGGEPIDLSELVPGWTPPPQE